MVMAAANHFLSVDSFARLRNTNGFSHYILHPILRYVTPSFTYLSVHITES